MSHLDEGTLHALLDGELDSAETHQIQAHLGRCTTCGTRLEEVRSVRTEADRLIDSLEAGAPSATAPLTIATPPVDTWSGPVLLIPDPPESVLRHQRQTRILGWAAMILVAVSAGYLAFEARNHARFSSVTISDAEPSSTVPPANSAVLSSEESVEKPTSPTAAAVNDTAAPPSGRSEAPPGSDSPAVATPKAAAAGADSAVTDAVAAEAAAELAKLRGARTAQERTPQPDENAVRRLRAAAATADFDRAQRAAAERQVEEKRRAELERTAAAAAAAAAAARPAPPPSLEQRAQVYLRIGLDEAASQLGGPMHVIEGMAPALVGLTQGRLSPGMDSTRPVVRVVYLDATNRLIILDQQRTRAGQPAPPTTQLRSVIGDVIVQLRGDPSVNVLRNLATRIR